MRATTLSMKTEVVFYIEECCNCGVLFGMTQEFHDQRYKDGESRNFYCPNGHSQCYAKKSDARLRKDAEKKAEEARLALQAERDQREAAERELERLNKRTAGGACPHCNRTFVQLARHIKTKHPDHAH